MEALHKLIQKLMLRLLYDKSKPVCTLAQKQAQCDTSNLGCLLQTFPQLCDSSAREDANRGPVMSTVNAVQHIRTYGSDLTFPRSARYYETDDHAGCGLDKVLLPEVRTFLRSVQGLFLPSNSSN